MKKLLFSGLAFVIFSSSFTQVIKKSPQYTYQKPEVHDDGIITGDLTIAKIDTALIAALTSRILADSFRNVHSLLIQKDGQLVYENYFTGKDQKHGKRLGYIEHHRDQLHDCRSISKTIVAACIGIAIQKGIINSVNDPAGKYLPGINGREKQTITIQHLLTMTSGLSWKEIGDYGNFFNNETQMGLRFNPIRYILNRKLAVKPGSTWNYSAGNTQLLAEIIHQTSGLTVDEFAAKYLFSPLGINTYEWVTLSFKRIPAAASGLRLSSRDLLKFGSLFMNNGKFNSSQIIDSNWINESLQSHIDRRGISRLNIKDGGFGYAIWIYNDTVQRTKVEIVEAKGNGGQSIFLCRSLNLLVVTTGGNYNRPDNSTYKMLTEYIIPAVMFHKK